MRSTGYASLAIVGVAACIAVYALNTASFGSQSNLYTTLSSEELAFMRFIAKHTKSYTSVQEFQARQQIFKRNLQAIAEENSKNGNLFTLGVNKFADWTEEELQRILIKKDWA